MAYARLSWKPLERVAFENLCGKASSFHNPDTGSIVHGNPCTLLPPVLKGNESIVDCNRGIFTKTGTKYAAFFLQFVRFLRSQRSMAHGIASS
jgi:hypothetical protein